MCSFHVAGLSGFHVAGLSGPFSYRSAIPRFEPVESLVGTGKTPSLRGLCVAPRDHDRRSALRASPDTWPPISPAVVSPSSWTPRRNPRSATNAAAAMIPAMTYRT